MVNYQLGKIYKIFDLDTNECYIGSTCEPTLAQRLAKHVANHKAYTKGTGGHCTSYSIIEKDDYDSYDILLIENYPCNSRDELHVVNTSVYAAAVLLLLPLVLLPLLATSYATHSSCCCCCCAAMIDAGCCCRFLFYFLSFFKNYPRCMHASK